MESLLTTLGEGRAFVRIYSKAYEPIECTRKRYLSEYRRYLDGVLPEDAPSAAAAVWAMAGVRYGAITGITAAMPMLERALASGDASAAEIAGTEVRKHLAAFEKYPPTPMGRRIRPTAARRKRDLVEAAI
jgi:hypothetical protein